MLENCHFPQRQLPFSSISIRNLSGNPLISRLKNVARWEGGYGTSLTSLNKSAARIPVGREEEGHVHKNITFYARS